MEQSERCKQLLQELKQERSRGNRIRSLVTVTVLVAFVLFGVNLYMKARSFDEEALLANIQREASRTVWPLVATEIDEIAKAATPALIDAFTSEAQTLLPRINDRLLAESTVFQSNSGKMIKASLDSSFQEARIEYDAKMLKQYPDFKGDQAYDELIRRLNNTSQGWAQAQMDEIFSKHVLLLQSINQSVFALQEQAKKSGTPASEDDLESAMLLLLDIMNSRLEGGK